MKWITLFQINITGLVSCPKCYVYDVNYLLSLFELCIGIKIKDSDPNTKCLSKLVHLVHYQVYDGAGQAVPLDTSHTSTGTASESLVLRRFGALSDGVDYTFTVNVRCENIVSNDATASLMLAANTPPTGGSCIMNPTVIVPLEDQVCFIISLHFSFFMCLSLFYVLENWHIATYSSVSIRMR